MTAAVTPTGSEIEAPARSGLGNTTADMLRPCYTAPTPQRLGDQALPDLPGNGRSHSQSRSLLSGGGKRELLNRSGSTAAATQAIRMVSVSQHATDGGQSLPPGKPPCYNRRRAAACRRATIETRRWARTWSSVPRTRLSDEVESSTRGRNDAQRLQVTTPMIPNRLQASSRMPNTRARTLRRRCATAARRFGASMFRARPAKKYERSISTTSSERGGSD